MLHSNLSVNEKGHLTLCGADTVALAEKYGNGKLICTSRQSVEVPGIPFEKIEDAEEFALQFWFRDC